jgi:hypothetical protein
VSLSFSHGGITPPPHERRRNFPASKQFQIARALLDADDERTPRHDPRQQRRIGNAA